MKQKGPYKSTEFTRKQINVLYGKAKSGELKVEKWVIKEFYDLAEYRGYDDNRNVERSERSILQILDAMFAGRLKDTQKLIDEYTEKNYSLMGQKAKRAAIREYI